jgi:imidazolonepropionase-like amidohydrolase
VVHAGRISSVGPVSRVKLPTGVQRIDGTGKYLMPGLADMHGHFAHAGPPKAYPFETYPLLLVAYGVTTVRNMSGYPEILSFRKRVESGEVLGPQIFTTGPVLEGNAAVTADNPGSSSATALRRVSTQVQMKFIDAGDAAAEVEREKVEGYDAVKVYNLLTADAYAAIVQTAQKVGLPVYGHVPRSVRLSGALAARQHSIEHLTGYVEALQRPSSPFADSAFSPWAPEMVQYVDVARIDSLARATRDADTWNCPTLVGLPLFTMSEAAAMNRLQLPVMRYVAPERMELWKNQVRGLKTRWRPADSAGYAQEHLLRLRIVKALFDGGARILAGTDFAASFVVPGYSLHEELEYLVDAGLSPYQALRTATADAAEFLGREKDFGSVEAGKRADLLLLSANPLTDVRNANKIEGVAVHGRWLTATDLHTLLEKLAASFQTNQP